jgi:hypothetical protein
MWSEIAFDLPHTTHAVKLHIGTGRFMASYEVQKGALSSFRRALLPEQT